MERIPHRPRRALAACAALAALAPAPPAAPQARIGGLGVEAVPARAVALGEGWWPDRLRANARVTLAAAWRECEERGLFADFDLAAGAAEGAPTGDPRHDAAVYELLAATAAVLESFPDEALEARGAALIARVAAAQGADGRLDTHAQLAGARPFGDLADGYEAPNTARLIEAGLAWFRATGSRALLDVAVRAADFAAAALAEDGAVAAPPGRPGLEAALVELARATGDGDRLELAVALVDRRGAEDRQRLYGEAAIDDHPLLSTRIAYGEVERAVELHRGVAEIARATAYEDFYRFALTISDDVYRTKRHATGALGQRAAEGPPVFGPAFELAPAAAAGETCSAARALAWHRSLFLLTRHAVYPGLAEELLMNTVLGAVALDGRRVARESPLAAAAAARAPWPCACCVVSAARAIAELPGCAFAQDEANLYLATYLPCALELSLAGGQVRLVVETDYPRDGKVSIRYASSWSRTFSIHAWIPDWCTDPVPIGVNEVDREVQVSHGEDPGTYLAFQREWQQDDVLMLELPLVPRRERAAPQAAALAGRVCLRRGPEVYAFEAADHADPLDRLWLPPDAPLRAEWRPDLLGGVHVIVAEGRALRTVDGAPAEVPVPLTAIPYRAWGNRAPGPMRVWLAESREVCEGAGG